MKISITLDYEIFFGRNLDGVQRTLIEPAQALADVAQRQGVPLVFFVDATWLLRLREEARRHPALQTDHDLVMRQLAGFAAAGHELQLHVHPHWIDSHWDGQAWAFDLRRYRLHDFEADELSAIVADCTALLRDLAGAAPVSAYRAGGWCIQPFDRLRGALAAAGIRIDSTVYPGGLQRGPGPQHDFAAAPDCSRWFFEHDPLVADPRGSFLEVPIASHPMSPLFYWQMAAARLVRQPAQRTFGRGAPIPLGRGDLLRRLAGRTWSVVSIDGLKSRLLDAALKRYRRLGREDFVILGHPKAFTPDSLRDVEAFIAAQRGEAFVGLDHYLSEFPAAVRRVAA